MSDIKLETPSYDSDPPLVAQIKTGEPGDQRGLTADGHHQPPVHHHRAAGGDRQLGGGGGHCRRVAVLRHGPGEEDW